MEAKIQAHRVFCRKMKRIEAARDLLARVGESLADRLSSKSRRQAITLKSAVLIVTAELMEYQDGFTRQHVSRTRKYMQLLIGRCSGKRAATSRRRAGISIFFWLRPSFTTSANWRSAATF